MLDVIETHASQGELAARLETTWSTLNRVLRGFESLGLISVEGNAITLEKPDKLASYTW
jgi:DNA-binding MarR family transcriptional regulator